MQATVFVTYSGFGIFCKTYWIHYRMVIMRCALYSANKQKEYEKGDI